MSTLSTSVHRAAWRAAMGSQLLLVSGAPDWALLVRWNDPSTNIAAGAAFGSVTGIQPVQSMQLNATLNF